ncbi:hypothetical protein C9374_013475 [Naegleria lovaniensis]|uniref:EGF-like domain-containing protein n=1 Tax=Naegleria lovaniensis TaxID=51637 RepID=A0AA88KVK2_NAELO|nr:uncharacterized protein C9374_013475 [Naegleria lovaniensis]KAG2391990.1 hypothetical protein C9374_013475 [Naegleria lovaniensis]
MFFSRLISSCVSKHETIKFYLFFMLLILVFAWFNPTQEIHAQQRQLPLIKTASTSSGSTPLYLTNLPATMIGMNVTALCVHNNTLLLTDINKDLQGVRAIVNGLVQPFTTSYETVSSEVSSYLQYGMYCMPTDASYIYRSDPDTKEIRRYSSKGGSSIVLASEVHGLKAPMGIAYLSGGLIIADQKAHVIWRFDLSTLVLTRIAGSAMVFGFNGDFGPALNSLLHSPQSVAVTYSLTDLLVADSGNHRLRKINLSSGNITTVAGNGTYGFGGDGGLAVNALFRNPSSVTVCPCGRIFIADRENHRIRVIATNGVISTYAGNGIAGFNGDDGPATSASLNYPTTIHYDGVNGVLYMVDQGNYRVRKVMDSTRMISTIAGNGLGRHYGEGLSPLNIQFNQPQGIAISSTSNNGEIIISDTFNQRIRKYGMSGNPMTTLTVAGTSTAGYNGDSILAMNANLNGPRYVAVDPNNGDLIVADSLNHRIRPVSKVSGVITTIAGVSGQAGFAGDGGLANSTNCRLAFPIAVAVNSKSETFISDYGNNRVRKIDERGIITTIDAALDGPKGLAVTSNDDLIIADTLNHRIKRVTKAGLVSIVAGNGTAGYVGEGSSIKGVDAAVALFDTPVDVAVASNDDILVADQGNGLIRRISSFQTVYDVFGQCPTCGANCSVSSPKLNNLKAVKYFNGKIFYLDENTVYKLDITCPTYYGLDLTGTFCRPLVCQNLFATDTANVCSGNGQCIADNVCSCNNGFFGQKCELKLCQGVPIPFKTTCQITTPVETRTETIPVTNLNSKNVSFSTAPNVQVSFPSNFVSQLSSSLKNTTEQVEVVSSVFTPNSEVGNVGHAVTLSLYDKTDGSQIYVQKLSTPIDIYFYNLTLQSNDISLFNFSCMYLEETSLTWKSDGIESVILSQRNDSIRISFSIICRTSHLTSFAVIDFNYKKASSGNDKKVELPTDTATIIGLAVGIGGGGLLILLVLSMIAVITCICCYQKRVRQEIRKIDCQTSKK